ncbi:ABC transporter ATP-binding protein (plasmid) [Paracoccus methylovorus]|uniref:ABC transporter ATP-binding protein n=1 Tax=Paracoccus methylovorus TaxID=2812658 RepID=A0ABX7JPP4_9RHOB|nr:MULTISPECIES: ABC transporter ATP-binding protein [Paracoccus]QRZ16223.1 ABC transporter ATP-binding protein [Paracoccus methylovorus]
MVAQALKIIPQQAGSAIGIEAVSHRFDLEGAPLPVLDDISFDIEPGSFVALLGPSGCGKSTLLRLIAGLDHPAQGHIRVAGDEVADPDPSRILVFQDPTLFPWRTVRANVALGLEAQGTLKTEGYRVGDAIKLVGLSGFDKAYPHQLSGGMAQRVALARALVNRPNVLLLDEPLGKLDSLTRLAMQTELTRLWQQSGLTAVLVTHDVEEALYLAQRVIVFGPRPARVVADLRVDLPYPRHRGDPRLAELRHEALGHLGLDSIW